MLKKTEKEAKKYFSNNEYKIELIDEIINKKRKITFILVVILQIYVVEDILMICQRFPLTVLNWTELLEHIGEEMKKIKC